MAVKVVLLLGPSSAGKSTTCKELKNTRGWHVISCDDVSDRVREEAIRQLHHTLRIQGIVAKLAPYMMEEEVQQLCLDGLLNISLGAHLVKDYKFPNPHFPGLKTCLMNANFDEKEIQTLAPLLQSVGEIYRQYELPDLDAKTLDEAFKFNPVPNQDISVILDVVPDYRSVENTKKFLDKFNARVENFRRKYGEDSIQSFIVLAYCTPQDLSERIKFRNDEAERNNNIQDKREGLFPFQQLGVLATAHHSTEESLYSLGEVSRAELMKISYVHRRQEPHKTNKYLLKEAATAIVDYGRLSKQYGLRKEDEFVQLVVNGDLKFDIIINTTDGVPEKLAQQIINTTTPNTKAQSSQGLFLFRGLFISAQQNTHANIDKTLSVSDEEMAKSDFGQGSNMAKIKLSKT